MRRGSDRGAAAAAQPQREAGTAARSGPAARRPRALGAAALVALALAAAAPAAEAVEPYLFTVGVLGGIGGPLDADEPDPGIDQQSLQVQVGMLTEPRTLVMLRVGRLEMDDEARLGGLSAPSLEYATIAGEYRFYKEWYDSGIFLGLGGYRLEGEQGGGTESDTSVGATLGVTGEVEVTRYLSIVAELAGHWADLDAAQLFGAGHVGVAVRF
jgi:hypothetical protein